MQIQASSHMEGLPTAKAGEKIKIILRRMLGFERDIYSRGAIYILDPFGARVTKLPFRFGKNSQGEFQLPLKKHLFSGIYTVSISFKESKIQDLAVDKNPFGSIPNDLEMLGCFRLLNGHPANVTYRLTYEASIQNLGDIPLRHIQIFVAVPPPFPPRQKILKLKPKPTSGKEANDLIGNNWLRFTHDPLPPQKIFRCGYEALIQNKSVRYTLPVSLRNSRIPRNIQSYTKPENFIESHHHLIKDLARSIAKTNRTPILFVKAAMKSVAKKLRYRQQEYERGAAYAIEKGIGDCTEYAALFTALCRANGIPSRLEAGFASNGSSWERHAWSEVWIRGQWIPVDPTWHGNLGLLGITSRHIPLIIGNWMGDRIRQEFTAKWYTKRKTASPNLDAKWTVKRVAALQTSEIPPLNLAPAQLQVKVPDAVPRGSPLRLNVTLMPVPKVPRPIDQMVMTATMSDGIMDQIVAIEPFSPQLRAAMNLAVNLQMPQNLSKVTVSLRLWVDRKPTATVWQKTIGLI
jgi:transglutaminase-like putative cysteine protease